MFRKIRSLSYHIFFPVWTAFSTTVCLPFLLFGDKAVLLVARLWAFGTVYGLKYICNVSYEFRGLENIPQGACIIASKHQSAWDTAIFFLAIKKPTFVYKKELSKIPLYGTYLKHLNMIGVDRSGGSKSLKNLLVEVKKRAEQDYALVIFPEGTRTKPFENVKFKPGVAQIYLDEKIKAPIIPTVLNSGHHWSKGRLDIPPGKIVVEFLPAIKNGLNRGEFAKKIQSDVENAYKAITEQNDQAS